MLNKLKKEVRKLSIPKRAKASLWFFKTGPGQYGEGDKFLGLTVPQSRVLAQKYKNLTYTDISKLLKSPFHEERLIALLILVHNFQVGNEKTKQKIYKYYLKNTNYINNWDLVDLSAHKIVGAYLLNKKPSILFKLAKSKSLWERRISIVSTFAFIHVNQLDTSVSLAKILLNDKHDLMHKAVGWVLREVGKQNKILLTSFLNANYRTMARTTLRYAIEKFSKQERLSWLNKKD